MKNSLSKILYLVNLPPKIVKVGFFALLERLFRRKMFFFFIKDFFDQHFWNYSVFESFVVERVIFWIKKFKCVRPRAVFSQLDKFRIEIFRTAKISGKKVLQRIRLKWNWFVKKTDFDESSAFRQSFLWSFYPTKCQLLQLWVFSKLFLRGMFWEKKTCFESKTLRKITFWISFFTTPQTFKQ